MAGETTASTTAVDTIEDPQTGAVYNGRPA